MAPQFKHFIFAIYQLNIIVVCVSQKYLGESCKDTIGSDGICVLLSECPGAQDDLKKGLRPVNCGFQNKTPIVCCNSTVTTTKPDELQKADYWCKEYLSNCPNYFAITNGEKVLPREFPHMAAIGYGEENGITWNCGGTLISDKFVLTAAHCMSLREVGQARWILLGTELLINTTSLSAKRGQIHPVVRRTRHPEYKPPSKYNDIALLEIGPAVTPNALPTNGRYLHPACLPIRNLVYSNYNPIATGWGRVGHGEDGSPELLKVELKVFESSTCEKAYEVEIKTNLLRKGIDFTMLCAGNLEGGKDTCQGDSGGPLQYAIRHECMYEVWGITSFGKICALANSPSIYTSVSAYLPWIEDIVWPN